MTLAVVVWPRRGRCQAERGDAKPGARLILPVVMRMAAALAGWLALGLPGILAQGVLVREPVVDARGFNFCVTAVQPSCLKRPETFRSGAATRACQAETGRFVDAVFVYRDCLEREVRRAVREANDVAAQMRCKVAGKRNC